MFYTVCFNVLNDLLVHKIYTVIISLDVARQCGGGSKRGWGGEGRSYWMVTFVPAEYIENF